MCFTAGWDVQYEPTKNQFTDEPEKLRQFRDHRWKALGEENSDLLGLFFCDHFDLLSFKTTENKAPTKIYPEDLNSPRRELSNGSLRIVVALLVRWQIDFCVFLLGV